MSSDTTTSTPVATPTGLPRRRQVTEWTPRVTPVAPAVRVDAEAARQFGEQVQAASQQTARAAGLLDAARLLDAAAAIGPADETARKAAGWAVEIRSWAAPLVVVPERSDIRPEVPGD